MWAQGKKKGKNRVEKGDKDTEMGTKEEQREVMVGRDGGKETDWGKEKQRSHKVLSVQHCDRANG